MPIKHQFTASSGDLISSDRWNQDHLWSGEETMQSLTWLAESDGYVITCTTADTWYDAARARIKIPGALFPAYTRSDMSAHFKLNIGAGNPRIDIRVRNVGNTKTLAECYQMGCVDGNFYTIGLNLSITFPTGTEDYLVQVKSDLNNASVTLYNITTWFRKGT